MKVMYDILVLLSPIKIFKLVLIAVPYTKLGIANSIQSTWKWKGLIWRWFCHLVCQRKDEIGSGIWES